MPMLFVVLWFAVLMAICEAQTLPDPKTTPGAITTATAATLCAKGFTTKSIRPPEAYTEKLKKEQLAGAHDRNPAHYEEDHLVSLELGGHPRDRRNLWPQPYTGTCGARVKDKIEDRLHELVCASKVTLADAQADIAHDWVGAYNRYIGPIDCGR